MNRLLSASSRRARLAIASVLLGGAASSFALNTATIVSSALSPDCLEYRVVGICYWLFCTDTEAGNGTYKPSHPWPAKMLGRASMVERSSPLLWLCHRHR